MPKKSLKRCKKRSHVSLKRDKKRDAKGCQNLDQPTIGGGVFQGILVQKFEEKPFKKSCF
jgi:hypothetical protein